MAARAGFHPRANGYFLAAAQIQTMAAEIQEVIALTDNDKDAATRTIFGEARGEEFPGQVAVAWVIRNRAAWQPPAWWGHTVADVCQHPYQFSCWNIGDPNCKVVSSLSPDNLLYELILTRVVLPVMNDEIADPTNGATMYKVIGTTASWDNAVADLPSVEIGHHVFYRLAPNA